MIEEFKREVELLLQKYPGIKGVSIKPRTAYEITVETTMPELPRIQPPLANTAPVVNAINDPLAGTMAALEMGEKLLKQIKPL